MRTESEMIELIISTAKNDERVRAVILNGSRANDFVPSDKYQDYDLVYLVSDFQYFVDNKNWIDVFGERTILEMPAYKDFEPSEYNNQFNYQMLFTDGNRIDLTFAALEKIGEFYEDDKMGRILLDKDNLTVNFKYDNGKSFFVTKPTKRTFENRCNSFWWCTQNVAKGIKRRELPYTMQMLNIERENLDEMISWYIGLQNNYQVSAGKMGKYFEKYLDGDIWLKYVSTFPIGNYEEIWLSLLAMCGLFRQLAIEIASAYSYDYPHKDDRQMTEYLNHLRKNE